MRYLCLRDLIMPRPYFECGVCVKHKLGALYHVAILEQDGTEGFVLGT